MKEKNSILSELEVSDHSFNQLGLLKTVKFILLTVILSFFIWLQVNYEVLEVLWKAMLH
ncbi:hypothetical protein [Salinimicrobium flavum]|uniref:Uncharacterized protein n=1 Tax=Salinimicrobium flavum TaxID=1737065 RepID=A0ABW5IZ86_9FLAO